MSPADRNASTSGLFERAVGGDRRALARLLSVVERGGDEGRALAGLTYARAGAAYTVGMTGAPGSGKSTLTGAIAGQLRREVGTTVAVIAVDPSSPLSGGAILGDRVRMQEHALDDGVYVRSMATRGHLGGLAAAVPDAVRLLDAANWPLVIVETVGVGQVEVEVAATCDTVVVVVNPGWGDSVQANKAGLLEIADVLVINKADRPGVRETRRDLQNMLELSGEIAWTPPIVETVASSGTGVAELWTAISSHREFLQAGGELERRRSLRAYEEALRLASAVYLEELESAAKSPPLDALLVELSDRRVTPFDAALLLGDAAARRILDRASGASATGDGEITGSGQEGGPTP